MSEDALDWRELLIVRAQLSRALLMGRIKTQGRHGGATEVEAAVPEVAKLVVASAIRGAGLVSTAYGWLCATAEAQRLLDSWLDLKWWDMGNADSILVALNAGFLGHRKAGATLEALPRATRALFGRSLSFGAVKVCKPSES